MGATGESGGSESGTEGEEASSDQSYGEVKRC